MRNLNELELTYVSGAGDCCSPCPPSPAPHGKDKQKGNNGFGNGGSDGANAGKQDASR